VQFLQPRDLLYKNLAAVQLLLNMTGLQDGVVSSQNKCSTNHIAQAKSEVQVGDSKHSVTHILANTQDSNGIQTAIQNISESGNSKRLI